ncbi:hypothetical protein J2T09_004662 [Neorhizobium huautlense]|uniref:Uncharacterized protein n=1 Tax=Neorhizobium huautlense TaxID=67774 RepID=A0ABT9PZI5_9HYPH|nr:hypothetical protein [Neorhizobium huautlense]MDP9839882.1 hypothetical protein [Neorhizobium huautlense]
MPFYLVSQTSLVEASDEQAAAQKAVDQLRSGRKVAVVVKSDETTISHIAIEAEVREPKLPDASGLDTPGRSPPALPLPVASPVMDRSMILKRMLGDARALFTRRP